jgi:O-antigen/teichoic acid export membrane protein
MPAIKNMKDLPSSEDAAPSKSGSETLVRTTEMAETAKNHNGRNGHRGHNGHLTSGRLLARNTVWNLVGNGGPMAVAIFCIPVFIKELGTDRFGVLTLAWAVIGYAGLFDLGLGRALTQLVAKKLGAGEDRDVPTLVWTSLLLMLGLGLLGAVVVVLLSPWLVYRALHIPPALQREALRSFYLLGLSIPVVISTAGLRGLLEAHQRFGMINALRVPMGVFSFAGPLFVLPFSQDLFPMVAVLVAGRLLAWIAHLILCLRVVPELSRGIAWQRALMGTLLRFGGWMTVSNIVGPLMVTLDRFLIGALISVSAVAYYATPYEVVTKFWLIPGALVGVMFPAFSTSAAQDRNRTALLFGRSVKCILLALFPVILLLIAFAQDGMRVWLGAAFAAKSVRVLQWLGVGVFINSLAHVPFALVQGVGKPDLTAKLHLLELPVYLAALFWLTKMYGIEGSAIAWTGRVTLDALVLFIMAGKLLPIETSFLPQTALFSVLALVALALAALLQGFVFKSVFLLLVILSFVSVAWFRVLSPEERKVAQEFL